MARKVSLILSHWYHLIDDLQQSPQQFYSSLERAIDRRQIQNLKISRVDHKEGGILSAKREYFRVQRNEHIFDVCAAPFGNGFFVSWWLGETPPGGLWSLILLIPYLGEVLVRLFRPITYFRHDTALMFQQSIHSAVLEVVDEVTKAKGLRALSELERKPILTSLFNR
jgi:hypothetical protein